MSQDVRYVATDFAFAGTTTTKAGVNRITLINHGKQPHHLVISNLPSGATASQMFELIVKNKPAPQEVQDVGGPGTAVSGDTSVAWVKLAPGNYMITCWMMLPNGKPHVLMGMFGQLRVEGTQSTVGVPITDVTITAREYELRFSRSLRAGQHWIRFENRGKQGHDFEIVRLAAGTNALAAARRLDGDTTSRAAYTIAGGMSGVGPNHAAFTRINLTRGRYAIFCFVPDEKDGKPHYRHGMLREFVVR